ncbi:MAG: shikimate kinase [Ruminococcaceae bacterium]|nr:shikimate kinase [Oscillospiraceae bacterium]
MKCGLLGAKLGHSYSPQIHSHLGSYSYELLEKSEEELGIYLQTADFSALNVTIPYKTTVIPYCKALSPIAKRLGSVNTIVRQEDGSLLGHNTDYFGFETMLLHSGLTLAGKKVLVLGTGGTSKTAVAVLQDHKAQVVIISRSGENNYTNLHLHKDAAVIVNTTPVGMYPQNGAAPLSLEGFPRLEGVLDVIYNPAKTALLLDAERRGLVAMNGLLMLVAQAKEAAQWFTKSSIPDEKTDEIHHILRQQMENIILIGMPGSGKSTVGRMLAEQLGKEFVDADAEIVRVAGCAIPEIFANQGESGFRALETQVLAELCKTSGKVIATGGGCVTREENYPLLHQNGKVFCLVRNIDALPTDGRPLSQTGRLEEMYRIRKPMYEKFADCQIDNNGTPEHAAGEILKLWEEGK